MTIGRDCYSKYPWGIDTSFEPEGYLPIMCVAMHGILPKPDCRALYGTTHQFLSCGIPELVATDRSSGFAGEDWSAACAQIGIEKALMPRRKAWFRGGIENYIRSVKGLVYTLPSATLSEITARHDYETDEVECISLTAFNEILHWWLLDIYAPDAHGRKKEGSIGDSRS